LTVTLGLLTVTLGLLLLLRVTLGLLTVTLWLLAVTLGLLLLLRVAHLRLLGVSLGLLLLAVTHLGLLTVTHLRLSHLGLCVTLGLLTVTHWLLSVTHRLGHDGGSDNVVGGSRGLGRDMDSGGTVGVGNCWWCASLVGVSLSELLAGGAPLGFEMDGASLFAFVLNFEPLINALVDAEGTKLNVVLSNVIGIGDIFIEYLHKNIITDVLDIDVHKLAGPLRALTLVGGSLGLDSLHTGVEDNVGIHLAEGLSVTGELSFNDVDAQFAGGCHNLLF
jgi:hypothetical protein